MLCYVHLRRRSSLQIFPKPLGVHLGVSISETNLQFQCESNSKIFTRNGNATDLQPMTNKLRQYFPMIHTRQEVLAEIEAKPKLKQEFYSWKKSTERNFWIFARE